MIPQITAKELAQCLHDATPPHLLDVRELGEHQFAALPNSTLIPLGELAGRAGEIEAWKEQEVVVYCHHGMRSQSAIRQLQSLGFAKLRNLAGGIDAWSATVDASVRRY